MSVHSRKEALNLDHHPDLAGSPNDFSHDFPGVTTAYHWTLLLASLGVLLASVALNIRDHQVTLPVVNQPLPSIFTFKGTLGIDCPGCGLTRCFVSMGQLDWRSALQFHPVGVFLFSLIAFQVPYRILQLLRLRWGLPEWQLLWPGVITLILFLVAVIVQWFVRVALAVFGSS
jgi:hypothetical protein